jgi:hypothetical protein
VAVAESRVKSGESRARRKSGRLLREPVGEGGEGLVGGGDGGGLVGVAREAVELGAEGLPHRADVGAVAGEEGEAGVGDEVETLAEVAGEELAAEGGAFEDVPAAERWGGCRGAGDIAKRQGGEGGGGVAEVEQVVLQQRRFDAVGQECAEVGWQLGELLFARDVIAPELFEQGDEIGAGEVVARQVELRLEPFVLFACLSSQALAQEHGVGILERSASGRNSRGLANALTPALSPWKRVNERYRSQLLPARMGRRRVLASEDATSPAVQDA